MTDTITPASLRAHADWMRGRNLHGSANSIEAEALRLEAESAREVEVLQFAKRLVQEEFGGYNQWHDLSSGEQERRVQYVKFILAFLAADGRLLPEGATGEFEPCGRGVCAAEAGHDGTCAEASGWDDTQPAVSVPLELPAEPGSRIRASVKRWGSAREWADTDPYVDTFTLGERDIWHAENDCLVVGAWNREYITVLEVLPAAPAPDDAPDGTPEKPWPTWQDVPEGVVYRGARDTSGWDGWFNRSGTRRRFFDGALSKNSEAMIADEAPFVRVDGDKA